MKATHILKVPAIVVGVKEGDIIPVNNVDTKVHEDGFLLTYEIGKHSVQQVVSSDAFKEIEDGVDVKPQLQEVIDIMK